MFRRRLAHSALLTGSSILLGLGCAKELTISEPVDPSKAVVAQFDPTNPIPVLRVVPTPTAIVQNVATGELNPDRVKPLECELPSTKQCLAFVQGWPLTTPITLFFSGAIDEETIMNGIQILELPEGGAPRPVEYTAMLAPRDPIADACFEEFGFGPEDLPPGDEKLVLTPTSPLKPRTRYAVLVTSTLGGGGIRTAEGDRVEPSRLFHILNQPMNNPPISVDGTINNPLLRQSLYDLVRAGLFPEKAPDAVLTAEEQMQLDAAVMMRAADVHALYLFFSTVLDPLVEAEVAKREDIIFFNWWISGPADSPEFVFDPNNSVVPFPNNELLTVADPTVPGGLRVELPNDEDDPVIAGLNTLNGFSTTAPISIPTSAEVDPMSIDPSAATPCTADDCNVVMYALSSSTTIDATKMPVPLVVLTTTVSIVVVPALPLLQNTNYLIVVKEGLKTLDEEPFIASQTFRFLGIPAPFVDAEGNVLEAPITPTGATFKQALECSFIEETGELGSASEVAGRAGLLENRVNHQRFLATFAAVDDASIDPSTVLTAFTYKTQDLTGAVDFAKAALERDTGCNPQTGTPCYEDYLMGGPRVIGPVLTVQGGPQIAALIGVVRQLCVPLCLGGAFEPNIPRTMCDPTMNPAIATHPLCTTATQLVTSQLDTARLYLINTYQAIGGSPFAEGTFSRERLAVPRVQPIPMWVVTGTTANPGDEFPIVVFQHGLGSQKEAGFYMANTLANTIGPNSPSGYATVMIDLPFHGSRASDITQNMNGLEVPCAPLVDPADVTCGDPDGPGPQPIACAGGCDGTQDPSGTGFLGINLFATRDNFRQGTIDQLTLLHVLREESGPGGVLEFLDASHIGYVGQSLGGITGGNLAAYLEPDEIDAVVLNVGGGGLVYNVLLETVPQIAGPLFAALAARGVCMLDEMGRCKDSPSFNQFKVIATWVLDPGDPYATSIGVIHELRPGRTPLGSENVLIQMAQPDPVVPNPATYALARAYFPPLGMNDRFQIYDFSTATPPPGSGCHSFLLAPVCGECLFDNVCNTLGAQIQAATFVASGGQTISPQKVDVAGIDCDNPNLCTP